MNIIVDYGLGNLGSVIRGFNRAGIETKLSRDLDEIKNADSLILPGVGAFGDAMNKLNQLELVEPIVDFAKTGKYMIGICLYIVFVEYHLLLRLSFYLFYINLYVVSSFCKEKKSGRILVIISVIFFLFICAQSTNMHGVIPYKSLLAK